MHETVIDGAKQAIVLVILGVILSMSLYVLVLSTGWQSTADRQLHKEEVMDNTKDLTAMAVYGKPIPMPEVVAALDRMGQPEILCMQMEDLKNQYGGTPYPVAEAGTDLMDTLMEKTKDYLGKKVYIYTASPNGYLQLCISELAHEDNPDGNDQDWSH